MRKLSVLLLIALISLSVSAAADVFDDALAKAGLTRQTAKFDTLDLALYGGDPYRSPYFNEYYCDPYRAADRVKLFRKSVIGSAGSAFATVSLGSGMIGERVGRSLLGNPASDFLKKAEEKDALQSAVLALWNAAGKKPGRSYIRHLKADCAQVPPDIAKAAAVLLYAEVDAVKWRNLAFHRLAEKYNMQSLYNHVLDPGASDFDFIRDDMMRLVDLKLLICGAEDLAAAIDSVRDNLSKVTCTADFHFSVDTPLGTVALNGIKDDVYLPGGSCALIIDAGGNDTYYSGAATTSAQNCTSVLFDLAGNDKYLETPELDSKPVRLFKGRQNSRTRENTCGALMGYAFLVDMAGNDRYADINNSQAHAAWGVAMLMDMAGNDTYDCYQSGQGNAIFGIAVLSDREGNDNYRCFTTSQGFGATKGFGLLADSAGNDTYTAENTIIDFPSGRDDKHNGSLAQGVGMGERADFTNGHSLAGGIGALVDGAGNDTYSADVMAQGTGYWYGLGILADGGGDDNYTGYWYNFGSAAHFAVGLLDDAGGNDSYTAPRNMGIGAGHDFSFGFFMDEGGNDTYNCGGISLGGGNANGIGIFWDVAGDDIYNTSGDSTLGKARFGGRGSSRDSDICLGMFLDTGGNDTYPTSISYAKNNTSWINRSADQPLLTEVGVGIDSQP